MPQSVSFLTLKVCSERLATMCKPKQPAWFCCVCRVVPLFLGWGGMSTHWEEEEEAEEGDREAKGPWNNFGRILQPAQQKWHPTSEPTVWQILVGDFQSCAGALSCP